MRIIPVPRVTLRHNAFVDHPLRKFIRPAADEMLRLGPLIAETPNQHFVHRYQRRVRQHRKESRVWLRERHFQGGIVNRFYPQRIGGFFPLGDIGRVGNMHVARIAGIR